MLKFPNIPSTILTLGPFQIRWYGLLYIISFIIGFIFVKKQFKAKDIKIDKETYENLLFNIMLGVIIGGRVGYILFYNLIYYIHNPLHIFAVWEGGMSFHGGALGVIVAGVIFCKKHKLDFYKLADPTMPIVAIGLGLGRFGNFINGELYGRPSTLPWAMIFPDDPQKIPRHPSQLYELLLEGIVLSLITFYLNKKNLKKGTVFWTFIGLYGVFRTIIEFAREPDVHIGFLLFHSTMGQILSVIMVLSSIIGIILINNKR